MDSRDKKVEDALFRMAVGYRTTVRKPVKVKEETNRPGEGKQVMEKIVIVQERVYVEPKLAAQMEWLKHRMPEVWGDHLPDTVQSMQSIEDMYMDAMDPPAAGRTIESLEEQDGEDPVC